MLMFFVRDLCAGDQRELRARQLAILRGDWSRTTTPSLAR